ncbi:MAG: ABC transporter ATP-binding protein [Pseudomonas sp.]|uniref:ABC transporter ATP-binding protein n=1 Tax=Pseudomonas sp. TaxID=306 RepID=UPI003D0B9D54
MIELNDLSVWFGGVQALKNVSVSIDAPLVGIIGPNGAGKTTLLNVLSGFITPRTGSLHAFGTDLGALSPARRARWGLRRSFQRELVVEDLSVLDNIRAMLDPLPGSRTEKRSLIDDVLDFTGLTDMADTLGERLNGFERRRVELAKTLVGKPRLVLLDEPGGGLSGDEMAELQRIVLGIGPRFSATTLMIDHDVELIASTCSKTLVLDFGTLIAYGPTAQVLQDPRVKAAYLGDEEL